MKNKDNLRYGWKILIFIALIISIVAICQQPKIIEKTVDVAYIITQVYDSRLDHIYCWNETSSRIMIQKESINIYLYEGESAICEDVDEDLLFNDPIEYNSIRYSFIMWRPSYNETRTCIITKTEEKCELR